MIVKGKKLSKLLQERKLTRQAFADKLGVDVNEVDKMLAGVAVGYETARKFVYFLTANCAQFYIDWQTMGKKNPLR